MPPDPHANIHTRVLADQCNFTPAEPDWVFDILSALENTVQQFICPRMYTGMHYSLSALETRPQQISMYIVSTIVHLLEQF